MKVGLIGVGHVGLVTAATLAKVGHEVVAYDDDPARIDLLLRGNTPFFEPELQELVDETAALGSLAFTHQPSQAVAPAEVVFICVGTPGRPDGQASLIAVERAATMVGEHATGELVLVEKSTVPVKTADRIKSFLDRVSGHPVHVVSNPEFLREGRAVKDSLYPQRILVGADDPKAHEVMRELYAPLLARGVPYFATDLRTAELAKHACNSFLALKISFANALARICEAAAADVTTIADIMGSDPRIGRDFLDAGLGYGGFCLPKDVAAFRAQAAKLGYEFRLLDEILRINDEALTATYEKIKDALWNLEQKRILLLGLSFKPGTDDVRESPALRLARMLIEAGAIVVGYDPTAAGNAVAEVPELAIAEDVYAGAEGADCLVVCTEWPQFKEIDLARIKGMMTHPIIVDGRNLFDPQVMANAGFTYFPTGRPPVNL